MENQVPIIENPPLAQALYKSVEVGQEIPAHLYRAVAEILAYIFKLMGKTGRNDDSRRYSHKAAERRAARSKLQAANGAKARGFRAGKLSAN